MDGNRSEPDFPSLEETSASFSFPFTFIDSAAFEAVGNTLLQPDLSSPSQGS